MNVGASTVAVVTGGGSGIGRGTALAFARKGAAVFLVDTNRERAEGVGAEVDAAGGRARVVQADVTSDADLESVREACIGEFGRVDVVMNNVGTLTMGWPHEVPLTEWQRVIDVNLLSIVRSIRIFVPLLVEQGEGHLVNTSSTSGLYPYAFDRLPYAATKAAVVALSECLALYLRPRGVGISCVCPGAVVAEKSNFAKEQMVVVGASPPPLRRSPLVPADPDDIGDLVVDAIEQNTFLVLPQPDVQETILRKWQDPDDFLDTQIRELGF